MTFIDQRGQTIENQTNIVIEHKFPAQLKLHQIGEPIRDFVGRETEIEILLSAFDGVEHGSVISCVRGMGGVGKTELVKVLAKRLKDRFPDSQISFNLRGVRDDASSNPATTEEALAHVVRSFHPNEQLPEDIESLRGLYYSVLEGKRVLLLMDNALDAQQLSGLVPPPDGCGLIVTSRYHFILAGMSSTLNLDTLSLDEAPKLLLNICPRIDKQSVTLARQCGYLPLALRLAASALASHPTLTVENYITELNTEQGRLATIDAYKNWTNEKRGIEATLSISYHLLEDHLQQSWRALGVFPGDFDTSAARTVWKLTTENDARKTLSDLYSTSMVLWDEVTERFHMHDLARDYAHTKLSKREYTEYAQYHATHYLFVLRKADSLYKEGGDTIAQGIALCDLEWGNIETGQAWVAANWEKDDTVANMCNDYPSAGIYCLHLCFHIRNLITWFQVAIEAAKKLGNRQMEGVHLGNIGLMYEKLGEFHKAIEYHEQALFIHREIGDRNGEGAALGNLGNNYRNFGEFRKAIEYHEQALGIDREIVNQRGEASTLGNLGNAYSELGELEKAIVFYEQALNIACKIGDRLNEGNALGCLGNAYKDLGNLSKAIELQNKRLTIAREIGDYRGEGNALFNLGKVYAILSELDKAIEFGEQALVIYRKIGDQHGEGKALCDLGIAFADCDELHNAIEFFEQYLAITRKVNDRRGEGNAMNNLGRAYSTLNKPHKAIEFYEQTLVIDREGSNRGNEAQSLFNLANELAKVGHYDEALNQAKLALEIFEQIKSPAIVNARILLEHILKIM